MKAASKYLFLFCLWWCAPVSATTVVQFTFGELVDAAELVFEGEVIDSRVVDGTNGRLHTLVTFRVDEVVTGIDPGEFVELRFLGGRLGDRELRVSGQDIPPRGERGIYFVENTAGNFINPLAGWTQGHFVIETDAQGNEWLESPANPNLSIINRSPGSPLRSMAPLSQDLPATPEELKQAVQDYLLLQAQQDQL